MATVEECRESIEVLAAALDEVEPAVRARVIPARTVTCLVRDLDVVFGARLDAHGVHDLRHTPSPDSFEAGQVRVTLTSDELVALAAGTDDFLHAWLRGRITVAAGVRDLLRLRALVGL